MSKQITIKSLMIFLSAVVMLSLSSCGGNGDEGASSSQTLLNGTATKPTVTLRSLEIKPSDVIIPVGTTGNFTAIAHYSDNSTENVSSQSSWHSENTNIVSILISGNNAGYAEALSAGSTTVTATYNSLTSNAATVLVTELPIESLELTPIDESIGLGGTVQYTVIGTYGDNSQSDLTGFVSYTLSDVSIAIIDVHGLATTTAQGTTVITAISDSGITSNTATLEVVPVETERLYITPTEIDIPVNTEGYYFTATLYYNNGTSIDVTNDAFWDAGHQGTYTLFSAFSGGRIKTFTNLGTAPLRANYEGLRSNASFITVVESIR